MDRRIKIIFTVFCVWFIVLGCRLWHMQVFQQTRYKNLSVKNRTRFVRLQSGRGKIYDRNGILLADNKPATQLVVVVGEVEDRNNLAERLSSLTSLSYDYILKKIKEYGFKPFTPAVLASDMSLETLVNVSEAKWYLPGASIQVVPVREYLLGSVCSHVIGYVGEAGERDIESGYIPGDIIGRTGLEKKLDKEIRGEPGYKEIQVDYRGNIDAVLHLVEPKDGQSFFLTIDSVLQEELVNAMTGKRGAGVVMNPQTGEILAMVSSPSFDPNCFVSPVKADIIKNLFTDKERPMLDRVVAGVYPPGSVFKIIVALAALEKGVINKNKLFLCDGQFQLGNAIFRCWEKKGHTWVNLSEALKRSCNEYFYQVGLKTGHHAISDMAKKFGFGFVTGIDLPGEKSGFVPDNAYFDGLKRTKNTKWSSGDTVNFSIGHGKILVTPLQAACFISAVANGGVLYKPKILFGGDPEGKMIDINKEHLDIVKEGLYRVINEIGGTGHIAFIEGLDVAGKTGTVELTENRKKRDICWFTGFAPFNEPKIAVVVVTEEGESGGVTVGPIARKVFAKWKELQEKQFSNEEAESI
jgi:penicillin-binding protein 2